MRSFLVKDKRPMFKWRDQPEGVMFKGQVPSGFNLAISPGPGYIVVDIDMHGTKDGYESIPNEIMVELSQSLFYRTKNSGTHVWLRYSGDEVLPNKTSNLGIDIRVGGRRLTNEGGKGYVVWYNDIPIEICEVDIRLSSPLMNEWIESIFKAKTKLKR